MDSELTTQMESQLATSARGGKTTPFHPFPRLPIELRIKIWEELIPETHSRLLWVSEPGWMKADKDRFASALLSISHESREVYLKRFPMGLEVCERSIHQDWFAHHWRLDVDWYNVGVVYISPEHDVLIIGQPWEEHPVDGPGEQRDTGKEFTLLAKDCIRNVIEFPNTANGPGSVNIHDSEEPDYETGEIAENKDGEPTEDWNFGGVTKRLTLKAPLDHEENWMFYLDAKDLSGSGVLQKWGGKFTVSYEHSN